MSSDISAVQYLSVGDYKSYQFVPGFHYKIPLRMSGKADSCEVSKIIKGFSINTKYYEGEVDLTEPFENQEITFYCKNMKSETNRVSFNISSLTKIQLDGLHGLKVNEWKWLNKKSEMNCGLINPNNNPYTKITERSIVNDFIFGVENDYKNGRSYNGYIKISENDRYSFRIRSGIGSGVYLRINGSYIISGCPVSSNGIYESLRTIDLRKGIYEIEIFYFNMNGIDKDILLEWKKGSGSNYEKIDKSLFYISPNSILSYDKEIITVDKKQDNIILKPIIYDNDIKEENVKYSSSQSMSSIGLNLNVDTGVISGNISSSSEIEKEYRIIGKYSDGKIISTIIHINIIDNSKSENKDVSFNIVNEIQSEKDNIKNNRNLLEERGVEEYEEFKIERKVRGISRLLYNSYDVDGKNITIEAENANDIKIYNVSNNKLLGEVDEISFDSGSQIITVNGCVNYKIVASIKGNNNYYYLYLHCEDIDKMQAENKSIVCEDSKLLNLNVTKGEINSININGSISNGIYFYPTVINSITSLLYCIPSDLLMNLHFEFIKTYEKEKMIPVNEGSSSTLTIKVDNEIVFETRPSPSSSLTYLLDVRRGVVNRKCTDPYGLKKVKLPTQDYKLIPLCVPSSSIKDCRIFPNTNDFTCDPKTGIISTHLRSGVSTSKGSYTITIEYIDDVNNKEHTLNSVIEIELSNEIDDYYPVRDLKYPLNLGNFINGQRSDTELIMEGNAKECVGENLPYGMSLRLNNGKWLISGNAVYLDSNNYTMSVICKNDMSESYRINYTYYVLNGFARGVRGIFVSEDGEMIDVVMQISSDGDIVLPGGIKGGKIEGSLNIGKGQFIFNITYSSTNGYLVEIRDLAIDGVIYSPGDKVGINVGSTYSFESVLIYNDSFKENGRELQDRDNEIKLKLELTNENNEKVKFNSTSLLCNPKVVDVSTVDVRYDGNIFRYPILTSTRINPINPNEEINRIVDCSLLNRINVSSRISVDKNCDIVINLAELGSYKLMIQPFTMVRECSIVEVLIEIRSCNEDEPNMVEYKLKKHSGDNVAYIISPNHVVVAKIDASQTDDSPVEGINCLPNGIYKTKGDIEFVINGYKFTKDLKTIEVNGGGDVIIGENQMIYYRLESPSNNEWYLPSVNVKDWDTILGNETISTSKKDIYFKTDYILESQNNAISSFIIEIDNKYGCSIYVNGYKLYNQDKVDSDSTNPKIKIIPPYEILHLNGVNAIGIELHTNETRNNLFNPNLKIIKYDEKYEKNNGDCLDITASLSNVNKKMNVIKNITNERVEIIYKPTSTPTTVSPENIDLSYLFRNDNDNNNNYKGIKFNSTTPVSLLISYQDVVRFPISNFGFKEINEDDNSNKDNKKITSITGVRIYGYLNDSSLKMKDGKLLLSDMNIPTYPINGSYSTNLSLSINNNNYKYYNITFYHDKDDVFILERVYLHYCLPITCAGFDEYNRSSILDVYNISNIYYEDDYQLRCGDKRWSMIDSNQIEPINNFKYDFNEYTIIVTNYSIETEILFSIIPSYDGIIRELKCSCESNVNDNCLCNSTSGSNSGGSFVLFDEKSGRISAVRPINNTVTKLTLDISEKDRSVVLQRITINIVGEKDFDGCEGENVWPNTKVGERIKLRCVDGMIGYRYRKCLNGNKWSEIDKTNCRKDNENENKTNIVKFEFNVTVSTINTNFDSLFDKIRSELLYLWRDNLDNNKYGNFIAPNIEDIKIEYIQPEIRRRLTTEVQLKITLSVEIEPTTQKNEIEVVYKDYLNNTFALMTGDNNDTFSNYILSSLTDSLYPPVSLRYCKELKPYYNESCQKSNEKWIVKQFESFKLSPEDNMYYHYNEYDEIKYRIVRKENEKKDRNVKLDTRNGEITIDSTLAGGNNITIIAETSKGKREYILNYEIVEKKCEKDGYWNETEIGKTVIKNCTDGYIGIEYRQCNDNGEWNDVDRDNCIYSNEISKPSKDDDVFIKIEVTYSSNPAKPERILRELEEALTFEDWEVRDTYKRKLSELSGININDISIENVSGNSFTLVIKANAKNNKELSEKVLELVNNGSVINEMMKEDIRYSDLKTKADNVKYETVDGVYDEPIIREEPDYSLKGGALAGVIIASVLGAIVVVLLVFIIVRCYLENKKE